MRSVRTLLHQGRTLCGGERPPPGFLAKSPPRTTLRPRQLQGIDDSYEPSQCINGVGIHPLGWLWIRIRADP